MNTHVRLKILLKMSFLGMLLLVTPAFGQLAVKIEPADPKFDDLESPNLGGNTGKKSWKPRDWLEVEVKVQLDAKNPPEDKHIDRLRVKWYVAVDNKTGDKKGPKTFLLEKEITHVNVPLDEDFYLSVYLSPATLFRLTGRRGPGKNAIKAVGGEITCEGAVKPARFSSMALKAQPWWQAGSVSRTDKFQLLNKNETPFKFLWWDRYLEIEADRR